MKDYKDSAREKTGSNKGQGLIFPGFYFRSTKTVTKKMIKKQNITKSNKTKNKQEKNEGHKNI